MSTRAGPSAPKRRGDSLRADANIEALQMALERFPEAELEGCVHHSDRGTQYTDSRYLKLLRSHDFQVSMGRRATDNAFAERINGVIKNEYLIPWRPSSFRQLKKQASRAVEDYNTKRHHGALGRCSPLEYERRCQKLSGDKRRIETIRSENTPKFSKSALEGGSHCPLDSIKEHPYCVISVN